MVKLNHENFGRVTMLFKEHLETFKKVVELAKIRRISVESNGSDSITKLTDISYESNSSVEATANLRNFLMDLDFELVKIIQTIMYLGRDKDYDKRKRPQEIYKAESQYFDREGWNTQEIEVNQIVEKLPLDYYLKDGFKILNIDL